MNQKNTGGPAFPGRVMEPDIGDPDTGEILSFREVDHSGMTLRDHFAGQALIEWAGMINLQKGDEMVKSQMKVVAGICYGFADAMIEARDK